jgi:DNA-binding CsgD family transcriptional regulator
MVEIAMDADGPEDQTSGMIGRDAELAAVEEFLRRLATGPAALMLVGEPGIGKTVLWSAGVERAERRRLRVLACRCTESEVSLAFSGLSDLLGSLVDETLPLLAPPRRRALEVALLLADADEGPLDERAVALAVLDALRLVASERPVLVAVDDLQWLDVSSARVLGMAVRRMRSEEVGLLATLRGPAVRPLGLEFFSSERVQELPLAPLGLGALHHLLRERLGLELPRPELVRLKEATGGNPFYALELGREVLRTDARTAWDERLRVPESLRELLGARLASLPADVLLLAAAAARPTVEVLERASGDGERVLRALDESRREGVIELDGARLRFSHPLLASICYQQAPIWRRRAAHRALADVVADQEERGRHLALATDGPSEVVACELDVAAASAGERGSTSAAAELCELAAASSEDTARARERRLRAAEFHRLAGDPARAAQLLEQLLDESSAGVDRADALFALAVNQCVDRRLVEDLCSEALAHAGDDPSRCAAILAFRAWRRRVAGGDVARSLADARASLEHAERAGDPRLTAVAIAQVGGLETRIGGVTPGLLERGAEIEDRLPQPLEHHQSPREALARRLTRWGGLGQARAMLEELETRAAARGDEGSCAFLHWRLATLEWLAGRWRKALMHAVAGQELAEQTGHTVNRAWAQCQRAMIESDLGLVDEARLTVEQALRTTGPSTDASLALFCRGAIAHLELVLGNLDHAAVQLRGVSDVLHPGKIYEPTDAIWADAVETLIALGELDEARVIVEWQQAQAARLGACLALGAAGRGRGLLATVDGDLVEATAVFEISLRELAIYPFERARTLLALGTTHRKARRKRAARETLEQALAVFEELEARLWAEKARSELQRISGRRSSQELTHTEQRVAALAARGASNKEIAAALHMSEHTVAAHLTHLYRKLGIRSRAALPDRLAANNRDPIKV